MAIFFTADTHFQHANIIKYCKRPFGCASDMDSLIMMNWNATVRPEDTVYHLGDVVFYDTVAILPRLRTLAGKKYLVPGNHDKPGQLELLREVFTILPPLVEVVAKADGHGYHLSLCHYPMESWNRSGRGALMLHGHTHGRLEGNTQRMDVGVDCWNFFPARLENILLRLKALQKYEKRERKP